MDNNNVATVPMVEIIPIIRNAIRDILGNAFVPSIYLEDDNYIYIGYNIAITRWTCDGNISWFMYKKMRSGKWTQILIKSDDTPLSALREIIKWLAAEKFDEWTIINFSCSA